MVRSANLRSEVTGKESGASGVNPSYLGSKWTLET